ncbi:MAG: HlyD family secretion protein [Gemmataceae bacterium]
MSASPTTQSPATQGATATPSHHQPGAQRVVRRPQRNPGPFLGLLLVLGVLASVLGLAYLVKPAEFKRVVGNLGKRLSGDAKPAGAELSDLPMNRTFCIAHVDAEHGLAPLYPLQPGRVKQVLVDEGQKVRKDQILFTLDDRIAKAQLEEAQAAVAASKAQWDNAKQLETQHREKIAGQQKVVDGKKALADAARRMFENLQSSSIAPTKDQMFSAQMQAEAAQAEVDARKIELEALQKLNPTFQVSQAESDHKAKEAQLKKAQVALDEMVVRAPADGTILRVSVQVGESLGPTPRMPAIQFLPTGKQIVRAEVEQEFATAVRVGQKAIIYDDARSRRDAPLATGKVLSVSSWYSPRRSMVMEPLQYNDIRTLECLIEVDPAQAGQGPENLLRIGQRVRVELETGGAAGKKEPAEKSPGKAQPSAAKGSSPNPSAKVAGS